MPEGSDIEYDPDLGRAIVINETNITNEDIAAAAQDQAPREVAAALSRWVQNSQGFGKTRRQGIFQRDKYVNPETMFEKFRIAADAVMTDDIISGVVETTEQLAFKRIAIECEDADQQDIWNQIADELNLPERMREIWRELFSISQAYPATIFGKKTYKLRGKSEGGKKRKKSYTLNVPIGITLLDPCKVIPFGNFMFGMEDLLYLADPDESVQFDKTLAGPNTSDMVVSQLIEEKAQLDDQEKLLIRQITGVSQIEDRVYKLKPDRVWRITSTRPDYQRFAAVRMESVFELLDLKHQLREMDRAHILGATNAIILVKKGDKDNPARGPEIEQLAAQVQTTSRVPIIVGDHRIAIEIITPKTDKTLSPERYNGLDSRITSRMFQVLSTGNYASGTATDDSIKLLRVIASTMEARRDVIRDSIMTKVFRQVWDMNPALVEEPKMQFYPRRIALDFDPNIATFIQDLRDRGDISRETILAELDILEEDEAFKREREADLYDDIFTPTNVPHGKQLEGDPNAPGAQDPTSADPKAGGRRKGGNTNGGGMNRQSLVGNPPPSGGKPNNR